MEELTGHGRLKLEALQPELGDRFGRITNDQEIVRHQRVSVFGDEASAERRLAVTGIAEQPDAATVQTQNRCVKRFVTSAKKHVRKHGTQKRRFQRLSRVHCLWRELDQLTVAMYASRE
jgi:hypothetical protein